MALDFRANSASIAPWLLTGSLLAAAGMTATLAQQGPARTTQKVVLENELVRVIEVQAEPGSQIEMRDQPDKMVVVLEGVPAKNMRPSRRMEWAQDDAKPGSGASQPARGPARGTSFNAARVIVIEFKKAPPGKAHVPSLPLPFKPVHENAHAVQFEMVAAPGQAVPTHTHGKHVSIALADGAVEMIEESGQKQTLSLTKGTTLFAAGGTHSEANIGKTALHLIVVELKEPASDLP